MTADLDPVQVAALLGVRVPTVFRLVSIGMPVQRRGTQLAFDRLAVASWVEGHQDDTSRLSDLAQKIRRATR